MVWIYYHRERVEVTDGRFNQIKDESSLEKRLADLGWTQLRWEFADNDIKDIRIELVGLPPNYNGEVSDYSENAIRALVSPEDPSHYTGEILVRDFLEGPVFDSKEGYGWGYELKKR